MTRLALIDYGMGNLLSVRNAFTHLGALVSIVNRGAGLDDADAIVLPGVGAFAAGMRGLADRGFPEALDKQRQRGKPILGICLGLQLLATEGMEGGYSRGLGWIPGRCIQLETGSPELRIPHIGWNDVQGGGPLFRGLPETSSFYFVHSYHLVPHDASSVAGRTTYGNTFVSMVQHESVFAVQFHPEKSHRAGLALLRNFLTLSEHS